VIGKAERGDFMKQAKIIDFPKHPQIAKNKRKSDQLNTRRKGSVFSRSGKLWVDFYYMNQRVREPTGLKDTPSNRKKLRKQLDLVMAEIENGMFEFAKRFPKSSRRDDFTKLEGRLVVKRPDEIYFGVYVELWWQAMGAGMSESQRRDYTSILNTHLLPYFSDRPLSDFTPFLIKKFLAHLKTVRSPRNKPLSPKRIQNILIPLRVIVKDAIVEHGWWNFPDPFFGIKQPKVPRFRVRPFSYTEWKVLMAFMPQWYRPYFEFAVQTGLRPSEQVALKWCTVDDQFIHVELSRVRNIEKTELKTEESRRSIAMRPTMQQILEDQKRLSQDYNSPYVFVNTHGRPILQDKLREIWIRVIKKSGLPYRRMYETRHTFASWALAAGETPEWVARTLGHVDTSMVFRTYGRYIPNLTRKDGSAFEDQFVEGINGGYDHGQ